MGQAKSRQRGRTRGVTAAAWVPDGRNVYVPRTVVLMGGLFEVAHAGPGRNSRLRLLITGKEHALVQAVLMRSDFSHAFTGSGLDDYMVNAKWRDLRVGASLLEVEQHALTWALLQEELGQAMLVCYLEHAAGLVLVCRRTEPVDVTRAALTKIRHARSSKSSEPLPIVIVQVADPDRELRAVIYLVLCARRFSDSAWSVLPHDIVTLVLKALYRSRSTHAADSEVVHSKALQQLADEFGCVLVPLVLPDDGGPGEQFLPVDGPVQFVEAGHNMHLEFLARQIAAE